MRPEGAFMESKVIVRVRSLPAVADISAALPNTRKSVRTLFGIMELHESAVRMSQQRLKKKA